MKLTHIELLESLGNEQQLMRLTFDGGKDSAYIIWSHANLMQYLNDEVIATFRQDMYNGAVVKFVNTLASVGVVHTLERSDNVKLYVDVTDNHSNIRFKEIEDGGTAVNAIVYVVDIRFDSSARADWADITVMDQARKLAQLRIFSPDRKMVGSDSVTVTTEAEIQGNSPEAAAAAPPLRREQPPSSPDIAATSQ